TYNNNLIR
nr:RecName: Full=Glucan endo-1,3-beta-glucosidase; AltName: Full=(1->3)-beta-glucan endohydrolase; Short=(1->3)-beta-glucanase; AltName: Full=Beta-1,3-endoglucanase [Pinus halepensis]